jgi:DNA-binding transcriptional LysR family regulator
MAARFDLRHLRYFLAVAEEGSFRRAAERLHLSQPPLSRQVRELEDVLGAQLFVRSSEGIRLTAAGEALQPLAASLIADAEALPAAIAAARPRVPPAIGVTVAVQPQVVAALERAWRRVVPGAEVRTGHSPALLDDLRASRLALALVGLPGDTEGLAVEILATEPLVAVVPRAHPAARRSVVSLQDFAALPLFWWRRAHNPAYFDHARRVFRSIGYRPKLVYVEPGQYLTLERISRGEGITLLNARRERIAMDGVAYRRFRQSEPLAIQVAAAWRPVQDDGLQRALARAAASVLIRGAAP